MHYGSTEQQAPPLGKLMQYEQPNVYQEQPPTRKNEEPMFEETPKYRDAGWTALFVIHLLFVIAIFIYGTKQYLTRNHESNDSVYLDIHSSQFRLTVIIGAICIGIAMFLVTVWLGLVKRHAENLIVGTFVLATAMWFGFGILLMLQGGTSGAIVMFILGFLNGLIFWWWRDRIPFSTAILQTVADRLLEYPAMTWTAYLSIVVSVIWLSFLFWTISVVQTFEQKTATGLLVFLIFSFYWTTQVIKNTVHVTVSGTVATWYFYGSNMPQNPTLNSFRRATSTSLGSICLGSLIVSVLETLRSLLRYSRAQRDNLAAFCMDFILSIIDSLIQYFNIYAFTQVAIYGKPYIQAAKDTWNLISNHGIQAIINDSLISNVLLIGSLIGGIACGILGAALGATWAGDYWPSIAAMAFLIGYAITTVAMEVVQSGVSTVFVCFAMDPQALQRNDPRLYQQFASTYMV